MGKSKIFIAGLLSLLLLGGVLTSCGLASSKINELCLVYTGGVVQDAEFEQLLKPGSNNNSIGVGSTPYCYNIDQRSYIATNEEGKGDRAAVEAVSADTVRLGVEYQLYFTLNQDEEIIREFHENLGVKTEAWTEEGWKQLLIEYVEPQIERAIEAAALNFKWRDLYSSEDGRKGFQQAVITNIKTNLKDVIGNDYFCGPDYATAEDECTDFTFTVGKPYPLNAEIVGAVESEQTAAAATASQEQKNAQIEAEIRGKQQIVDLYGADGALLYEAIKNGQIQIMVVPSDGSVTVPVPQPQG